MSPLEQLRTLVQQSRVWSALSDQELEQVGMALDDVFRAYSQHIAQVAQQSPLPRALNLDSLVSELGRNRFRVVALLQALAAKCSAEMLAMLWMVEVGARIKHVDYRHEREQGTHLRFELGWPGDPDDQSIVFDSDTHWDTAIFRFVSIVQMDEAPLLENFYPLPLPGEWVR